MEPSVPPGVSEVVKAAAPAVTLTDDDVFEDVGVVVRCGCHLAAAKKQQEHMNGACKPQSELTTARTHTLPVYQQLYVIYNI